MFLPYFSILYELVKFRFYILRHFYFRFYAISTLYFTLALLYNLCHSDFINCADPTLVFTPSKRNGEPSAALRMSESEAGKDACNACAACLAVAGRVALMRVLQAGQGREGRPLAAPAFIARCCQFDASCFCASCAAVSFGYCFATTSKNRLALSLSPESL